MEFFSSLFHSTTIYFAAGMYVLFWEIMVLTLNNLLSRTMTFKLFWSRLTLETTFGIISLYTHTHTPASAHTAKENVSCNNGNSCYVWAAMFYFPFYLISFKVLVLTTIFTSWLINVLQPQPEKHTSHGRDWLTAEVPGEHQRGACDPAVSEGRARKDLPGKVMSAVSPGRGGGFTGKEVEVGIPCRGKKGRKE